MRVDEIDKLSDDEAIAFVMLFGYDNYHYSPGPDSGWPTHCFWRNGEGHFPWKSLASHTKGEAARAYLKRHHQTIGSSQCA